MAHSHLSLNLTRGFKRDADDDYDRRARERDTGDRVAGDDVCRQREHRDNREEERAHERDLVEYLRDIIRGGFTGTYTRDESAVLL